jgi:hypothetical protein
VGTDAFDDELFRLAQNAQTARKQAEQIVAGGGEFLAAVEEMLAG